MAKYIYVYFSSSTDYADFNRRLLALENERVLVSSSISQNSNWFLGLIHRLHFSEKINKIVKLPFKKVWKKLYISKQVETSIEGKENVCFCFTWSEYSYARNGLLEYISSKYPKSKKIFFLTNKVEFYINNYHDFQIESLKESFDYVLTYNPLDSRKYNLIFNIPRVHNYPGVNSNAKNSFDVFFIGREKGRLDRLLNIAEICKKSNLSIYFHIIGVPKDKRHKVDGIYYGDYIPYSKALQIESGCRCVLDLHESNNDGLTLRDYEAIGMNKFLITDGKAIYETDFYTKEKIINVENLANELSKINEENQMKSWNGIEKYSVNNYFIWLDSLLSNERKDL